MWERISDGLRQVQVKSSNFEAEYGGTGRRDQRSCQARFQQLARFAAHVLTNQRAPASATSVSGANGIPRSGIVLSASTGHSPQHHSSGRHPGISRPRKTSDHRRTGLHRRRRAVEGQVVVFSSYIPSVDTTRRTTISRAPTGPRTLTQTTTITMPQPFGLRRNQQSAPLWLWNYGYFRATGARRPGQRFWAEEYRRWNRSQYVPFGCRLGKSAGSLQLRRRLDAYREAGDQRPLRLFLQQHRSPWSAGRPSLCVPKQRQRDHQRSDGRYHARQPV